MKKYTNILLLSIGFILGSLVTCSIQEKCEPIEIIIPEEKGDFDIKPKEKEIEYRDTIIYRDKPIYIDKPVDKEKVKEFEDADEDKKGELYIDCIKQREYEDTVEDENVKISYWAKTTGTLDDFKLNYTVKERKIEIPSKTNKFYYGGGLITNTKSLQNISFKGDILLNNKNKMYSLGYDTNQNIYIGAYFSF